VPHHQLQLVRRSESSVPVRAGTFRPPPSASFLIASLGSARALFTAAIALAGCGGHETGLAISMSLQALTKPLNAVRIDLHTPDRSCGDVFESRARILGSYSKQIDLGAGALMGTGEIVGIVPGNYKLAVWGFIAQKPSAFACDQITIQDGVRTVVPVFLGEF
jgi:hypothetical protein